MFSPYGKDFKNKPLGPLTNTANCTFVYKKQFYPRVKLHPGHVELIEANKKAINVLYAHIRLYKLADYQTDYLIHILEK